MRTSDTTGPAFWERPIWSSPSTSASSNMAAVPSSCDTVTTPVPPMPVMCTLTSSDALGSVGGMGSGGATRTDDGGVAGGVRRHHRLGRRVIDTNAGQSPSRQERSRLQLCWSIVVFRPNAVSIGCTDRQFETRAQSPQPSQTRWLITTRVGGVGTRPRLRSRRASAAQRWSWMSTVTPGVAASTRWASSRRVRSHTSTSGGSRSARALPGSSEVTRTRATPWASSWVHTPWRPIAPAGS